MATTQNDNRAKFLELRKQGISVADARNQTYGPAPVVADATPALVDPVTPVNNAPISPTTNVNQAQREANIASRQATPVATPAPVVPTVETPAPVEATVTPTTPTPTQTPFQQAQAESEKIKAQNEAQMKLNTQQADLKAQERQQVAQETAKATTPVNQKDVLNALVSGVSVAPQNTAAYRNAQMQYKTYQKFATMTPTQLADNMKMGEIGTETAQLLASNPNYIKAKEDFDKFQKNQSINNMIKSVAEGATGKTTTVDHYQNASDAIAKKLGITETNADAFARIVSKDPETLQLTKTVSNIAKQLNTLNTERNAVYEDLKKQYPDLSASAIMTLMAGRTKEATAQIDALNSSLTLTQADLKMAMEMAKAEYDATKEDITLQAGLAKEDRAMQQALDLSQAQFDQKLAQQAQLTNDPTTAITTMIDEYKKLGIPFTSTVQSRLAEFKASGKTLPQFLTEMGQNIQQSPAYKQYQAQQAGKGISYETIGDKVYKNTNGVLTETGISAKSAPTPVWQEWEDATGKHAGWVTPGVNPSTSTATAVKPTGNIVPVTAGNKTVRLDQSGAGGFESAVNQATTAGTPLVFRDGVAGVRDQVATIKEMADKNGIPFNANNPAETAAKIRAKGIPVADPGKSNHESGMAIDVYGDSKLGKVSPAQEKILNANGWYSAGIPGDAGHFEYRGGSTSTGSGTTTGTVDVPAYQKYLNSGTLPTGLKAGTAKANEWLQGYSQWKGTANPLSDSVQKRVDSYSDDYSKNANVVSAFKFAPLLRQYDKVKVSDLSSSQRQGIISDYAKALDPDSVVREGEYATVAKYSSSFGEKTLSEINQFLSGNGTLSDAAAQKVIDAIKSRGKNYVEQEKNVRNQYIEKINRATGYKDGDMQLVYPDYSTQSTNPQKSDFLNSLKSIATEFTKGLTSIK